MKQVEYKGRWVTIDVMQRGKVWSWTYQIDAGPVRSCEDRPLHSEALMEADLPPYEQLSPRILGRD